MLTSGLVYKYTSSLQHSVDKNQSISSSYPAPLEKHCVNAIYQFGGTHVIVGSFVLVTQESRQGAEAEV